MALNEELHIKIAKLESELHTTKEKLEKKTE